MESTASSLQLQTLSHTCGTVQDRPQIKWNSLFCTWLSVWGFLQKGLLLLLSLSLSLLLNPLLLYGMPTIQYSAQSARLMVTHSGHLNLQIQTVFWDRNGFMRQKRHFVEPANIIPEFYGVLTVKKIHKTERSSTSKTNFGDENDIFGNKTSFGN